MNVNCIFQEDSSLLLFFFVLIVLLKLQVGEEGLLKAFKQLDVQDEDGVSSLFFRWVIVIDMHVFEDIESSGTQWLVDIDVHLCEMFRLIYIKVYLLLR